jgi:hypothetical protein
LKKIYDKYLIYYAFRKIKGKKVKNKIHQILASKQAPEFGGRTFSPGPGHCPGLKGL